MNKPSLASIKKISLKRLCACNKPWLKKKNKPGRYVERRWGMNQDLGICWNCGGHGYTYEEISTYEIVDVVWTKEVGKK